MNFIEEVKEKALNGIALTKDSRYNYTGMSSGFLDIRSNNEDNPIAFQVRSGNFMVKITNEGIYKSSDAGRTWTAL